MCSSRRISLALSAESGAEYGGGSAAARLAARGILAIAGALALGAAALLVAAQFGWETGGADVTAWSGWLRALAAAGLGAVVSLLVWGVVSRRGERRLRLSAEHGDVTVPISALQRLAAAAALRHPDVVSVEARLRAAGGAPVGRLRLRVRPMADATALAVEVEAQALAALNQVIGRETTQLTVTAEVLSVRQLGERLQ